VEISVKRDVLKGAILKAAGSISSRDIQPILKNFMIQAKGDSVKIIATDLEIGAISTIRTATIVSEGSLTVPADLIIPIVNEAEEGEISMKSEDSKLVIKAGKAKWEIQGLSSDDYPEIPEFEGEMMKVDRKDFLTALAKVSYAMAEDETRENMMMVQIDGESMIAADGYRASRTKFISDTKFTIPRMAVSQLVKILGLSGARDLHILNTKTLLMFGLGPDVFSTRLLHIGFPDVVEKIFNPTDKNEFNLEVDRSQLLRVIKRVRITADEKSALVVLNISPGKLVVSAFDERGNMCEEEMPAKWTADEANQECKKGLNWHFLQDLLSVIEEDKVVFRCGVDKGNRRAPVRIDQGTSYTGVIMQMRVPDMTKRVVEKKEKPAEEASAEASKESSESKEPVGASSESGKESS